MTISTGTPQGSCLSPRLFSLYAYDLTSLHKHHQIITFADDPSILGLTKGNNETDYKQLVDRTLKYGEDKSLVQDTGKTKELVLYFRKKAPPPYNHWRSKRLWWSVLIAFWACTSLIHSAGERTQWPL